MLIGAVLIGMILGCALIKSSLSSSFVFKTAFSLFILLGGWLFIAPWITRKYVLANWTKMSLSLIGAGCILWSVLGFWELRLHFGHAPAEAKVFVISPVWNFVAGFNAGSLVVLLLSGAVSKRSDGSG